MADDGEAQGDDFNYNNDNENVDDQQQEQQGFGDDDDYYMEDFTWYEKDAEDYTKVFRKYVPTTVDPPVSSLLVCLCFCVLLLLMIPYILALRRWFIARRKTARRNSSTSINDGIDNSIMQHERTKGEMHHEQHVQTKPAARKFDNDGGNVDDDNAVCYAVMQDDPTLLAKTNHHQAATTTTDQDDDSSVGSLSTTPSEFLTATGNAARFFSEFQRVFTGCRGNYDYGDENDNDDDDYDTDDDDNDDELYLASGWREQYDEKTGTMVYRHEATGQVCTEKPVRPELFYDEDDSNSSSLIHNDGGGEGFPSSMRRQQQQRQDRLNITINTSGSTRSAGAGHDNEINLLYGPRPWYFYYCSGRFLRKLKKCARWDDEMRAVVGLTVPFVTRRIVVDVFALMEVGVIGRVLGTRALSAFFAVELVIELATMLLHGLPASLSVLVSQAIGAGNYKLAGTYVQLSVWVHQIVYLPVMLFWWNRFDGIVKWLGFDEETAESAQEYAEFALVCKVVSSFDDALHCVLNAAGFEAYSTFMNGMQAFLSFMLVLMVSSLYRKDNDDETEEEDQQQQWRQEEEVEEESTASLWMIGGIHLIVTIFFFLANVGIIVGNELLKKMWKGMWGSNPVAKLRPLKSFLRSALPLAIGYVMKYCEWEILFLFAVIMGPAEVAAWGLLGAVWQVTEHLAMAASTASKIRVANLLGSGRPYQAHYSSQKSLFWGVLSSCSLAAILGALQSFIPKWFTHDELLQEMVGKEMPLLCLGVALMSFASMAWAHLCAQGRSYLASGVTILGSIFITLPLVCLSTFHFSFGLEGLLAGMILGYAASAFVCSLLVITTDWTAISKRVMKRNSRRRKALKKTQDNTGSPADISTHAPLNLSHKDRPLAQMRGLSLPGDGEC